MFVVHCTVPRAHCSCPTMVCATLEELSSMLQKIVQFDQMFSQIVKRWFCQYSQKHPGVDPSPQSDTTKPGDELVFYSPEGDSLNR